jgi:predicted SAM-dependent methyltransferase
MRIAMPDLAEVVRDYTNEWKRHDWVSWPEYSWIDSGPRMVNTAFREWGHLYLYDFDELGLRLNQAGFRRIERCEIGQSSRGDLQGLETRLDSGLIVEASPDGEDIS